MKRAILLVALASMLAPDVAHAWCRMTTSRRQPETPSECIFPDPTTDPPEQYLEWRRPCSAIGFSVAASSSDLTRDEVEGVFARSIATWEAVDCDGAPLGVDIELLEDAVLTVDAGASRDSTCTEPEFVEGGGNVNVVMFVTDWADRDYDAAAFAVTTVWHRRSTGEILDADMEINERRGPYGVCPPEGCLDMRVVDLENVVTHELGHYLGLAHSEVPDATMYYSAVAGETLKRDLHADDVAGICAVYPPGSPGGECDYTPIGGLGLECNGGGCCSVAGRQGSSAAPLSLLALAFALLLRRRRAAR